MMRRAFAFYELAGPAILTPAAAWLWIRHYDGNLQLAAIALAVPILHAYLVPGIGTNVLGMWAFNTRYKIGRFRPQHGFLFGSATALLALATIGEPVATLSLRDMAISGLATGALLLAVNWIYDALALRHGILEVYNQPWADGAGPWAIAADYAVWFFGCFGLIYGVGLRLAEQELGPAPTWPQAFGALAALTAATTVIPSALYVGWSLARHGHSGCRPCLRPRAPGDAP